MKFLSGERQRLGVFYNLPVAIFFPALDMSNSNLLPVQTISGMFTCPCENTDFEIHCLSVILRCWFSLPKILVRTHGTPASSVLHG